MDNLNNSFIAWGALSYDLALHTEFYQMREKIEVELYREALDQEPRSELGQQLKELEDKFDEQRRNIPHCLF